MHSFTEENYLKTIFRLLDNGDKKVFTNSIAESLNTSAASVTDMLKKLAEKKLIYYEKYKGVSLTPSGRKAALNTVRKHRLWETFLVEKLKFSWDQVHEVAEQLEHIQSEKLIEQLDKFLNHPRFDPHGDPIPDKDGILSSSKNIPLNDVKVENSGIICNVNDSSPEFLRYISKLGLDIGKEISVLERNPFDHSIIIKIKGKKQLTHLSKEAATNILIR
jgi:DtxR family Mn-dependent transcriptional regulator